MTIVQNTGINLKLTVTAKIFRNANGHEFYRKIHY